MITSEQRDRIVLLATALGTARETLGEGRENWGLLSLRDAEKNVAEAQMALLTFVDSLVAAEPTKEQQLAVVEQCGGKVYSNHGEVLFFRHNFHEFVKAIREWNRS